MRIPERISLGGLGGGTAAAAAGASGLTGNLIWVVSATQPPGTYATSGYEYLTTLRAGQTDAIEFQYLARETGDLTITLAYAMTGDNGGDVELNTAIQTFGDGEDPDASLPSAVAGAFTPGAGTTRKTTTITVAVTAGDAGRIVISRSSGVNDTHTGDLRVLALAA